MRTVITLLVALVMVFGLSAPAHATLYNRGTDSLGNQLIYDTDRNITWYDYTNPIDIWPNQVNWADTLDVNFRGTHYTDWRLPTTPQPDSSCDSQFDPVGGFLLPFLLQGFGLNCTGSEMGHLYYTGLGNAAGGPLTNTGPFTNLLPDFYWSGTEYALDPSRAWVFFFLNGNQYTDLKGINYYALAVRPGDVAAVPEPGTLLLLGSGLVGLAAFRMRVRRRHG